MLQDLSVQNSSLILYADSPHAAQLSVLVMAGVATEPVPITDAAPVTSAVQFGTAAPISTTGYAGYAMEPMPYTVDGGAYTIQGAPQVMYSSSPYTIPGAASISAMPMTSYTTATPMPYSGLDHTQGKWFAPGEALPAGFVVTAHPEGHTAPLETHSMSDKARESFVVTGTSVGAKLGSSMPAKKSSKKSKKKKSSGCC